MSSLPTILHHPSRYLFAVVVAVSFGCASDSPEGADSDSPGGKTDDASEQGGGLFAEQLSFTCEASCPNQECTSSSNKDELLEDIAARLKTPFSLVANTPKDKWRFENPCFNDDVVDGEQYDGFVVDVTLIVLPFDPEAMDWELCATEVDDHFVTRFERDMANIGGNRFPQLKPSSSLSTSSQVEVDAGFSTFEVDVLDENGEPYFRYFGRFHEGCITTRSGGGFLD